MLAAMLRRLILLAALLPAIALAAAPGGSITVPPVKPSAAPQTPPAQSSIPSTQTSTAWTAPPDAAACRMGCANDSYVCRAGDHPESCDGAWSQCVATCNTPNLDAGVSTAP
jgi:hypothetical protein